MTAIVTFTTANGILQFEDREMTARLLEFEIRATKEAEAEVKKRAQVYTIKELAKELNIGETAAYALIANGEIDYVCPGRKNYRVSEMAVRKYLGTLALYPSA
jgi:excisionase family DNA binding protein